ncbi:MAG TPA: response regulator transcription factor [Gammaproteobacteria bacterium]
MSALRVLVVSDLRVMRESLTKAIQEYSGTVAIRVAACSVDEVPSRVRELAPDVVIVEMLRADPAEIGDDLRMVCQQVKTVALGVPEIEYAVVNCAQAGFSGFVPPDASMEDLLVAIDSVAKNTLHCSPKVAAYLFRQIGQSINGRKKGDAKPSLTEREVEVLRLVQEGLSNKLISQRLGIEVQTVKNHVRSILSKLGVQTRVAAAVFFASQASKTNVGARARGMRTQ